MVYRKLKLILLFLLVSSLAIRLVIIWCTDFEWLTTHLTVDDAFYYTGVAENFVKGNGFTFDGINPTNGFHPLFMLISIICAFFTRGEELFRVLLTLSALFYNVAAIIIFKLFKNRNFGFWSSVFWLFSPIMAFTAINGLETGLFSFFLWLTIFYTQKMFILEDKKTLICSGIVFGLTFWARTDSIFLIISIGILIFIKYKFKRFIYFLLPVIPFVISIFLWNIVNFGTLMQASGAIVRFKNWSIYGGNAIFNIDFWKDSATNLVKSAAMIYMLTGMNDLFAFSSIIKRYFSTSVISIVATILFIVFFIRFPKEMFLKKKVIYIYCFYLISLLFYYSLIHRYIAIRYFFPFSIVLILVLSNSFIRAKFRSIFLLSLIMFWISSGYSFLRNGRQPWMRSQINAAEWIMNNSKFDDNVGAFNAGLISYFSNRRTINLDGVINNNAARAIIKNNLGKYILDSQIDWLVDIDSFFKEYEMFWGKVNPLEHYKLAKKFSCDYDKGSFILVYRRIQKIDDESTSHSYSFSTQ